MLLPQLAQTDDVFFHHQFLRRLPHIPEKALRKLGAANDIAREGGQKFHRVVLATVHELIAKVARPVLRAHLPTVEMQGGQATAGVLGAPVFSSSEPMYASKC